MKGIDLNYNVIIGDFIKQIYFPIIKTKIDEESLSKKEANDKKSDLKFSLVDKWHDIPYLSMIGLFKGQNKKLY